MEENWNKSKIYTVNNLSLESFISRQNPVNLTVMVQKSSFVFQSTSAFVVGPGYSPVPFKVVSQIMAKRS